jgi:ABC-type antimicrobial peptide transport system permease subunit
MSAPTPLQGAGASGFASAEGFEERPQDRRYVSISYVAPRYFHTLGVPLLAGREFSFQDQANWRIAIINDSLRRRYFAGRDPLGKKITLDQVTLAREPATYEIVGVSGDAHYMEIREPARPALYLPAFRQDRVIAHTFVIRSGLDPNAIVANVKGILRDAAGLVEVSRVLTLSDQIDASIVMERLMAALSGFFAILGALLAGIGLYGLLAYTVARRTNEIGVRMALGASPSGVARMILRDACITVAAGLTFGVPLAILARRFAAAMVQDLSTPSLGAFAAAAAAIAAVALIAAYVPARRAARVDPIESLRQE